MADTETKPKPKTVVPVPENLTRVIYASLEISQKAAQAAIEEIERAYREGWLEPGRKFELELVIENGNTVIPYVHYRGRKR